MKPPAPPARRGTASRGGPRPASSAHARGPATAPPPPPEPWSDKDLARLERLLDEVPAPLQPMELSVLDGFLVGVALQPRPVPLSAWWPWVLDAESARQAPASFDGHALLATVQRRLRELSQAIALRQWFDPWVFELDDGDEDDADDEGTDEAAEDDEDVDDAAPARSLASEAVVPWVAGFSLATELFPELTALDAQRLLEPLAQLYMHLDPEDLEDADALQDEIDSLEPPAELAEAVESLVRASLLLADVSQPRSAPAPGARPARRPSRR
ncbi:UPF0149 family protein [Roseateles sp. BYS180W]|uniref:UPF0149 family protein n=1 Tax=Roseateles rivi TaxID=3299028 RepID=A0ABW7FTP1_9BURK